MAGRICIWIDSQAFRSKPFYPDTPLIHMYPSSKFTPEVYRLAEEQRSGNLVRSVYVHDRFIDVYFQRRWYTKSAELGAAIKRAILFHGNIDLAIPEAGFENAPMGNLEDFDAYLPQETKSASLIGEETSP